MSQHGKNDNYDNLESKASQGTPEDPQTQQNIKDQVIKPREDADAKPWYKMSSGEFYVYMVALFCGISMMMPVNAVFSAPTYMMQYYRFAMQDPDAVPLMTNFWDNVLTYYNLFNMVVCLIMEPLTLLPFFRRIPMLPRLLTGLGILIIEIIVLMAVPAAGTNEAGAVTTICMAGFIGGLGKSIFESTVYGMFGAFPSSFSSTMMGGIGISGVLTSLIQIIVIAALPADYEGIKKQSYIYYSLDVGLQAITFAMLILLRFNTFAKNHFGDLGGVKSKVDAGHFAEEAAGDEGEEEGEFNEPGYAEEMEKKLDESGSQGESGENEVREVQEGGAPADPTSNQLLVAAEIFPTLRKIKWMFVSCGFNFLITLFLFPTISTTGAVDAKWYPTVAVFIFNACDVIGRFSPSFKIVWPKTYGQRFIIVAASFARVIFVLLLLLHSYEYIHSDAFGYVMMVIFGLSNGYIGSMSMVLGPLSKGVDNDGRRFVAGTLMGISILVGGTIGTVFSIMTQTIRENEES